MPSPEPVQQPPGMSGTDVRDVLGTFLAQSGTAPAAPISPPTEENAVPPVVEPQPEPVVEIIEEDPRDHKTSSFFRKKKVTPEAFSKDSAGDTGAGENDDRIISVDQISDLSGLILPKGATFQIEEIKLHGRINAFESTGTDFPRSLRISGNGNSRRLGSRISNPSSRSMKKRQPRLRQKSPGFQRFSASYVQHPWNTIPKCMAHW